MIAKIKIFLVALGVLILFIDIYYYFFYSKAIPTVYKTEEIKKISSVYETFLPKIDLFINNSKYLVEVAQTGTEKSLGLGNRYGLNKASGMLFIFSKPAKQYFWMKDMKFPIDIVWIDENKKIVGFVESAKPEDYPEAYPSPQDVSFVLEIGSGEVKNQNIKIGDTAIFDFSSVQK